MQVVQSIADLHCPVNHSVLWLRTVLFQYFVQRFTFDIVHDDVNRLSVVDDVNDTRESRMVQTLNQVCFSHQAVHNNFVVFRYALFPDFFDGPLLI